MRKKLSHNWGLKLASLVLAFVIWFLVVQIENPPDSRTFSNVQVKLVNTGLLEKENKVYEILDDSDTVRVTVQAPRSIIEQLRASDIVAEADMNKLTDINTIAITYYVQNTDIDSKAGVIDIQGNHDVVRLNVEEKASKYVTLAANTVGEVASGYIVGGTSLDQNMIEVSGPKSAVEQVSSAGVDINVTNATSSLSANVEIQLYDGEGNPLQLENIKKQTNYVHVSVEVLATREVPVKVEYTGTPAKGYMTTGVVETNPSVVRIAGSSSALSGISEIQIPEERLSIAGADSDVVEMVDIKDYLPENVRLADSGFNGSVAVTVYVEPIVERSLQVPAENLTIVNVPQGLEAIFPEGTESYTLHVEGLTALIDPLKDDAVFGRVNVGEWMEDQGITQLAPGSYHIPVTFALSEDIKVTAAVNVHVLVRNQEE